MDWNCDGLNDIIVGEHNGNVKYFMAVTADSLTEMDDLKAAGEYINGGLVSAPVVFDWNNDSLPDLVVGYASTSSGSTIKVFLNIGTPGNPVLAAGVDVLCGGEPVGAFGCTPCLADLDQDGLADIIYGETPGRLFFCKNTGTLSSPVFAAPEQLQDLQGNISMGLNSSPFITDWNSDGLPDLLAGCGETGYLYAFLSPYTTGISEPGVPGNHLSLEILSNPVSSSVNISVFSDNGGVLTSRLYNIAGRLVKNLGTTRFHPGDNFLQFPVNRIPQGIYLLCISDGIEVSSGLITVLGGVK